ncbi:hypothetical protein [Actinotalea fermentans]|uniref:Uncharacterized protein n=1 Tax=Actinotalea fermentans TaxID=43671 RepID=A0A511YZB3_9CELL|nr:hypothetical protein [Actinotalea fermentans]KGM14935.1 hypothetical protein N867_14020 [Actinotalea fermentans ATCC 43279 = JCM 9966 = DSM 3133]GEN80476.1 hypothetical protein AFE02nite_22100 [Actinotalea fermentans]
MNDDARAAVFHDAAPLSARTTADGPDDAHLVPPGVDQATVDAVGKLTAALEVVEQARGMLYGFHRLTGRADNDLRDALDALEAAGHDELARAMREDLFGRNVLSHRWTFQVVEDYDDGYWSAFRRWEQEARDRLLAGRRHVYEAQLKERNRTHGRPGHEARPESGH